MKVPSYTDVDEVEIDGAKFQVGAVPRGRYRIFGLASARAMEAGDRRAILTLKAQGIASPTPEEVRRARNVDPDLEEEMQKRQAEVVSWAVKGHSGLTDGAGTEIPFLRADREYMGHTYAGASDATVAVYASADLVGRLYIAASLRNSLVPEQKKSSPPASGPTDGSSTATTA